MLFISNHVILISIVNESSDKKIILWQFGSENKCFFLASAVAVLISLYFLTFSKVFLCINDKLKKIFLKLRLCIFFLSSGFISMHGFNQTSWLNLIALYVLFAILIQYLILVLNVLCVKNLHPTFVTLTIHIKSYVLIVKIQIVFVFIITFQVFIISFCIMMESMSYSTSDTFFICH